MTDFLAAPFLFTANILLWIGAFITGRAYVLLEVHDDDDQEYYDGE